MRARTHLFLVPLGAVLSISAASGAGAQQGHVLVCRDGTRLVARTNRACARHRGVDTRATEAALQAGRTRDAHYGDGRAVVPGRVSPDGRRPDQAPIARPDRDERRPDDHRPDDGRRP